MFNTTNVVCRTNVARSLLLVFKPFNRVGSAYLTVCAALFDAAFPFPSGVRSYPPLNELLNIS